MISKLSLSEIEFPNHFLEYSENECPLFWKYQLAGLKKLPEKVEIIRNEINKSGCVIISSLNLVKFKINLKKRIFLGLCSQVGTAVEHNYGKKDYIWDIKPRKYIGSFPTFSEHNLEAPLHTDSQYLIKPEKYVALFVIKKASCGGGETIVLRYEDILNTLPKSIQGKECLKILKNSLFPFATPSIFCEHESHVILAPVISNEGSIRYRFDTIEQGLRCSGFSDKEKVARIWALNFFRKHIDNHPCILKLSLNDGEVLFLNNQKLLHGRTGFTDSNRHILRIRMNSL